MSTAFWFCAGVCTVAVSVLLLAERRGIGGREKLLVKGTGSMAMVLAGLAAAGGLPTSGFGWLALAGLAAGMGGDLFLCEESGRSMLAGLAAFGVGHALYIAAAATVLPPWQWAEHGWPAAIVLAPVAVAGYLWLHKYLSGSRATLRVPVAVYLAAISVMTLAAVTVAGAESTATGLPWFSGDACTRPKLRFAIGAIGFCLSDFTVARNAFVHRSFTNEAAGLPLYYASQLLIASALAPA